MAAAPVHTLTVTNIHHINQHQCFPNKDTRSWSLSLIIDKKITEEFHLGTVNMRVCTHRYKPLRVCACLRQHAHTGKVLSWHSSPKSCIISKPTIKKWQWQPCAYKSGPIIHLSLSVSDRVWAETWPRGDVPEVLINALSDSPCEWWRTNPV